MIFSISFLGTGKSILLSKKTITAAIAGASDGDSIFIYSGTYSETMILPTDKS